MSLISDIRVTLEYAAGVEEHASYTLTEKDLGGPAAFSKAIGESVEKTVREHLKTAAGYDRTIYGIGIEFGYRWQP